ncbi:hypothetical protein ASPWEDRAFT_251705 [Aspergillus wentii DTO 134E9]|uniref:BZIP domain-containing protein n=1 Tax=Aspergillus wentii DTO 134E9 TaxID=1073089 RepID=A0A1L9S227_ASPWE|nr:uncharacterized protein ASPWEDRAFT_251705 [Aspergillus wentii DTO 134E9]KAI9923986.1 hypothetical protein MW887_007444 [Aspergillus wentii]OJJ41212.1 hypothetical protein ASPWEDRAFT_251705 [Aspergillus wentii DTO 134E9]
MSGYNGRRAPNFSQYLEDLNAIPSPYDQAIQQQQQQQDSFNIDSELSLFTNAEFFDFDKFGDLGLPTFDSVDDGSKKDTNNKTAEQNADMKFLDLLNDGLGNMTEYPPSEFNIGNAQPMHMQNAPFAGLPSIPSGPINANPAANQSSPIAAPQSAAPTPASSNSAPTPMPAPAPKRRQSSKASPLDVEEVSKIAAEEDKRRRNTAASARFRVKKKMREQSLEKTVKETTDKNNALEARVTQLELENSWLKNLITEKNGSLSLQGKKSESDIADMFKRFLASQKTASDRSSSESKIGVGTSI